MWVLSADENSDTNKSLREYIDNRIKNEIFKDYPEKEAIKIAFKDHKP